jgi:tripartite-type tricarboxylate transporter receptor subunit TctC
MKRCRFNFRVALLLGWIFLLPLEVGAFEPTKPVEVIVHTAPGGGSDLFARAIAEMLQKEKLVSQRLQVVNKSGGGSAVAMS